MPSAPPIPVGVRLPLPTAGMAPDDHVELCRRGSELGFGSFWVGDHVILPRETVSPYPHGTPGFDPDSPWADPLLYLTWLAAQLPEVRFGTSIHVFTMRNPTLLAKQLATMSWLTRRSFSFGVGVGWLREEYEALEMPFKGRGKRAPEQIALIKRLLGGEGATYPVTDEDGEQQDVSFMMQPPAAAPVEFLWGGFSPMAMRIIASSCDGWLPAKQSIEALEGHLARLRTACDTAERDFSELKLVVKPGAGPDPESGAIDRDNLVGYAELGFHEAILEMPYAGSMGEAVDVLERVAARSWL